MNGEISTISEIVDKLITINIKLYNVLEKSGLLAKKENRTSEDMMELANLNIQNIALVQERSKLKTALDQKIKYAIESGNSDVLNEVKNYGGR